MYTICKWDGMKDVLVQQTTSMESARNLILEQCANGADETDFTVWIEHHDSPVNWH